MARKCCCVLPFFPANLVRYQTSPRMAHNSKLVVGGEHPNHAARGRHEAFFVIHFVFFHGVDGETSRTSELPGAVEFLSLNSRCG